MFRYCRVVFGISSSPFLLALTINHHLDKEKIESAELLKRSIFVDNCVTSVDIVRERDTFIEESTRLCAQEKFELRGWTLNRGEIVAGDVSGVGSSECKLGTGSQSLKKPRSFRC